MSRLRSWNHLALRAVLWLLIASPVIAADHAPDPWSAVPAILKRIVPPTFPDRVFEITKFGAVADGATLNTKAFADAIAACHQAGGGRVLVPAGKFLSGPIHLRSNVELHLAANAEIIFSDKFDHYLPPVLVRVGGVELFNYSPLIYARDCTNIAVTGPGKLNGNAKAWWDWKTKETRRGFEMGAAGVPVSERVFGTPEAAIRPSFLSFVSCTNILLDGFTIGSGPNWTIHPIYCQNTTIRRVNVLTDGPNNDGIDPDSCNDMLIEHCTFDTGDDCVVLKSGYNEDGWRVGRPTENVIMRHCFSKRGHGGLVIGSEMSGDVRNVFMEDCTFEGTDRAIRIKSRRDRGGVVEKIYARNIKAKNLVREVAIFNMDYSADRSAASNKKPPVYRDMQFENISADGAPMAILIQGLEDSPIANLRFRNLNISSTKGVIANHATGLTFDQIQIRATNGCIFDLKSASEILIRNAVVAPETSVFLKLSGTNSQAVRIQNSDLQHAKQKVVVNEGASPEAVVIE